LGVLEGCDLGDELVVWMLQLLMFTGRVFSIMRRLLDLAIE